MFALRKNPQRFEPERAKRIDALARTLHNYVRPLGAIEGLRMEDHLRDVIRRTAETGLELAQFKAYPVVRRNGCRPGDHFDPRLMTAFSIPRMDGMESELVKAGARVAIVLSPLLVQGIHKGCGQRYDVENMEANEVSRLILKKGNVVCYIVKEGRDGEKSVEFHMEAAEEVL
ncbi:hypothetical protein L211DRAFT_853722 [Terfezia boudieri ATCC MYA-4762]|uniref:Uncharacterized protein n=1 Tax=Terfezia boudieri ATCC MYA-4762 TaxID=1051890 RepID=A0A3N4L7P5_9PEZI|nr:hypothetical protein L211DRAFT_853722 [Terfezia boudieri ATCC MYA-4762]